MEIIDGSSGDDDYRVVAYDTENVAGTMLEFDWDKRPSYLEEHEGDRELAEINGMLELETNDVPALEPGDEYDE